MRGIGRIRKIQRDLQTKQEGIKKSVLQKIHNPENHSRPVFLVGCGRSGTSMLIRQLDKSWQIKLYNENHPDAFDNFRLREFSVIDGLIERSKAPVTLFKPILSTTQTMQILERYPDALIVFSFRHFDDVINSSLKKFGVQNRINHVRSWMDDDFSEFAVAPPPEETKELIRGLWKPTLNPESGAALFWLFYNQLFYDFNLDKNSRAHLIRYETLVTEPKPQFMALTQFLELQYEEQMAEGIFASSIGRDNSPAVDVKIRVMCERLYRRMSQEVLAENEAAE